MRTPVLLASCALVALGAGFGAGALNAGCAPLPPSANGGSVSYGGNGGGSGLLPGELCDDPTPDTLAIHFAAPVGTLVDGASGAMLTPTLFLTPCPSGQAGCPTPTIKLVVDPDTCMQSDVQFATSDASVAPAPAALTVSLHDDRVLLPVQAGPNTGTATITATIFAASQTPVSCATDADCSKTSSPTGTCHNGSCMAKASASFTVQVVPPDVPACNAPKASIASLSGGGSLQLGGGIASISLPKGATNPDQGSFLWGVTPFPATIACGGTMPPSGYVALGPPITFGPESLSFQREVPLAIPINPALMPTGAYLRHVRVSYSGPAFKAPRVIPVADMHVAQIAVSGSPQWVLTFKAPRLGTYQAVVAPDAGTHTFKRHMTHRGVVGISMGGGGTATFGTRHHDLFDVMAPLGGPVDWTWMLDYIANNQLGGFRPIASGTTLNQIQLVATTCMTASDCKQDETCLGVIASPPSPGKCVLMPKPTDPYAHPQTFNTWWYEYPRTGNGGSFDRGSYAQIFRDLALMYGNPNSDNFAPGGENLPSGVPPTDKSVAGDHPIDTLDGGLQVPRCAVTIDPVCPTAADGTNPDSCPSLATMQELQQNCPIERCKHTLTLQNYYDHDYNPDGIFPVITVCDGSPQNQALTPYANTWGPNGNNYPLEVGLAVDYNGNGVRDELEPVIRQGHEPWDDDGTDGVPSAMEPGYMAGVNDDPNGDDYNAQYNPSGTENDHRYQMGEHFDDVGIDGVPNTAQQPATGWQKPGDGYDVGEGDGKFTVTRGLQRFWDHDAHSIVRQMVDPANVPGGAMTDDAIARIDVWSDGGLRDLFNFEVAAQHLVGAYAARGRLAGYLTAFTQAPGLDPTQGPGSYDGRFVDFDAMPGIMLERYGEIDPSANDIQDGSGQHVGSADEVVDRLESALYFMGSRWRDRQELFYRVDTSTNQLPNCTEGSSTIVFPAVGAPLGPSGRRGPVGVSLPPGYCNANLQKIRYPVIYLLHGYGQGPQDLEPTIVLLQNFMNSAQLSMEHRLVKAIIVYVDGRCRNDGDGVTPTSPAECLRGTFFADSPRMTGAQDETWWLELMNYMDANYRTLGSTDVAWVE